MGEAGKLMFGYAEASYDPKTGRFSIPANLFAKMGGDTRLRLTVDPLGRFLELRSEAVFQALAERFMSAAAGLPPETSADLLTEYLAFSSEIQVDNVLRVVVPKTMRDVLGDDGELALVAVGDAVRLWNLEAYRRSRLDRREHLSRDYTKYVHLILGIATSGVAGPAVAGSATETPST